MGRSPPPLCWAMGIGLEIIIVLLLIVLNGVFAMSELALVSVRRARLAVLERKGVPGATHGARTCRRPAAIPAHRADRHHPGQHADRRVRRRADRRRRGGVARRCAGAGVRGRDAVAGARGRGDDLPDAGAGRTGAEAPGAAPAGADRGARGAGDRLDGVASAARSSGCSTGPPARCCACSACTARRGRR